MTPVLSAVFTSLLWALSSGAPLQPQLDDGLCAVQTSKETSGPREGWGAAGGGGAAVARSPAAQAEVITRDDDEDDEEDDPDRPAPRAMTPAPTSTSPADPFFDEDDTAERHAAPLHPRSAASERKASPAAPTATPQRQQDDAAAAGKGGGAAVSLKGGSFDIFEPGEHTLLVIPRGSAVDKSQLTVRARVDNIGPPCNGWLFLTRIELEGKWLDSIRQFVAWTNMDGENDVFRGIHFKVNYSTSRFGFNVSEFADNIPASLAKVETFPGQIPTKVGDYVTTLKVTFKWRASTSQVRMVYQKEVVGFSNSMWFTTTSLKDVKGEIGGILGSDDHAPSTKVPPQCLDKRRRTIARRAPPHRGTVHAAAFLGPSSEG